MTIQVWSFMLCHLWSCRQIPAVQRNMPLPSSGFKSTFILYIGQRLSSKLLHSPTILYEGIIQETALWYFGCLEDHTWIRKPQTRWLFLLLLRIHHLYPENSSKTHQIITPKSPGLRDWSTCGSKNNVPERIDHIPLYQSPCVVEWSQQKGLGESVGFFLSISDRDLSWEDGE